MPRGGNNGGLRRRRRRQVAAPRDHERRRRREDGNDRAWNQVLEVTSRLRFLAFILAVALLVVAISIGFILESSAAVSVMYAGFIGTLSSLGAIVFVPREAMGGLVTIGLVFFFVTLISLVFVCLTHQ